jgi:hypothetical protein
MAPRFSARQPPLDLLHGQMGVIVPDLGFDESAQGERACLPDDAERPRRCDDYEPLKLSVGRRRAELLDQPA